MRSTDPNQPLTPSEKKFVKLYLEGKTVPVAYVESRPKAKNQDPTKSLIKRRAYQFFRVPKIKRMIDASRRDLAARTEDMLINKYGATRERIMEELAKIAFTDYDDVHTWDTVNGVQAKDSAEIPKEAKGAIVEITESGKEGKKKLKIKLADKRAALETLGKAMGMFTQQVDHKHLHVNFVIEKD